MFNLSGKTALVTGAARGMGAAHAKTLSTQGANVVITDLDLTACEDVSKEVRKNGGESLALRMDVSDATAIDSAATQIVERFGAIDILVNNAGIYKPQMADAITAEEWDTTVAINLRGQFLCAQRVAKEMQENGWGRIINISSIASGQVGIGIAGGAHYTATKGGVIGLTETLAVEWAKHGITVNAIGPGAIDTPMVAEAKMSDEAKRGILAGIPLGRFGTPEEVSAAVVFLASEEARYITGTTLFVDGGWLAA